MSTYLSLGLRKREIRTGKSWTLFCVAWTLWLVYLAHRQVSGASLLFCPISYCEPKCEPFSSSIARNGAEIRRVGVPGVTCSEAEWGMLHKILIGGSSPWWELQNFSVGRYITFFQLPSPQGLQGLKQVRAPVHAPGKQISAFCVHREKLTLGLKIKEG